MPSASPAPSPPPAPVAAPRPQSSRARRAARLLVHLVLWPLIALALAAGALWYWAGRDDSLAAVLTRAAGHLPPGQTLEADGVSGSLRTGGRIGRLIWQSDGLRITASEVDVGWDLAPLARSWLVLGHLRAAEVRIEQRGRSAPASPFAMPEQIALPVRADIPFEVRSLLWAGPPALTAQRLAGRYRYDGTRHQLDVTGVQVAQGSYRGQASLLARAPLALEATLAGELRADVPGGRTAVPLSASASVRGTLAPPGAQLQAQARLRPAGPAPRPGLPTVHADAQATLRPWAAQPVVQGAAQLHNVDLASLWPDAPQTALSGEVALQPAAPGWHIEADLHNGLRGPWDRQRVPLDALQASLQYHEGAWTVRQAAARSGPGRLQLQGRWQPAGSGTMGAQRWDGQIRVRDLDPSQFHTRLAPAALDGQATLRTAGQGVAFDARLLPAGRQPAASPLTGLRLREAVAQGTWAAPTLALTTPRVRTDDAGLQGQLSLQTAGRAGSGRLQLQLPGAQATIEGRLAPDAGAGTLALRAADTARALRWLAQWPGMPEALGTTQVQGAFELQARWQGGWAQASALAAGQAPAAGLALEGSLDVPRLQIRTGEQTPAQALQLRALRLQVAGPLRALQASLRGELARGSQQADL